MKKIIEITKGIQAGVAPDMPFSNAVVWIDSANVVFASSGIRPSAPQLVFGNKLNSDPITGFGEMILDGKKSVFWGSLTSLSLHQDTGETFNVTRVASPYAFARNQLWTFQPWGSLCFATAGGAPQVYPDGGKFIDLDLTGAGFTTAKIVTSLLGYPLLMNTNVSGTDIRWPDAGDVLDWEPTAVNTAGGLDVFSLSGPIIAAESLANNVLIFSRNEAQIVSYVGPPNYFRADKYLSGIGAVSAHSVVKTGNTLYGFSDEGLWMTDGSGVTYVDKPTIHRRIFDQINLAKIDLCHVWHNQAEQMVVVFWPKAGSDEITNATGYNYATGTLSPLRYARTATSDRKIFPNSLLGDKNGTILAQTFVSSDSEFPFPGTGNPAPLVLEATAKYDAAGYGDMRYGQGPYGGRWSGPG